MNVATECYRVLKKRRLFAVLIGELRGRGELVLLEQIVRTSFLEAGFTLRDRIIKLQHHDRSTAFYVKVKRKRRFLIEHEFLILLEKT